MIEEIEIEYKQLLNKEEYQKIEQFFIINNTKLINQENLYFETIDKKMKEQGKALRIRIIDNEYELCLKTKRKRDMLENNIILTAEEYRMIIDDNSEIRKYFSNIPEDIKLIGSLHTKRIEYHVSEGLLCLDLSTYLGVIDYEIEFEAINYSHDDYLKNFLYEFEIEYKENNRSKIQRFNEKLDEISQDSKNML